MGGGDVSDWNLFAEFEQGKLFCFSPVNLVDSYENRFAFACAFGATTTRCLFILLLGDYSVIFTPEMVEWLNDPAIPSYTASKLTEKIKAEEQPIHSMRYACRETWFFYSSS